MRREFTEVHMGVPVRLVLFAPNDSVANAAAHAAFAVIADLDDKMSDYRPESEVRRVARTPGRWTAVSPALFEVLTRAISVARASDGAFDPTAAPLVALWRESRRTGRLPNAAALEAAQALVGWRRLGLDSVGRRVRLEVAGMRLDLGGIAKGYILQEALGVLRERGTPASLVEAGGDIVLGDPPPGKPGWSIDIPGADSLGGPATRLLSNVSVATSGATHQFVEIGGVRYSHVVDPRTGLGVTHAGVVTVIDRDGAIADAAATALSVLGVEQGRNLVDALRLEAVFARPALDQNPSITWRDDVQLSP